MTRVLKAARANCAQLVTSILNEVVSKPDSNDSWNDLLLFGSTILARPKRDGKLRNLANIVNKRVAAHRGDQDFITIPESQPQRKHGKRDTEDRRLASAITSQSEAGNMRAAIRLLCSDDKPAAATAKTLEELEKKHS